MDDPRLEPVPEDHQEKIIAFARDLAYGAKKGDWTPEFLVHYTHDSFGTWSKWDAMQANQVTPIQNSFEKYLEEKWDIVVPAPAFLEAQGYLMRIDESGDQYDKFMLTPTAFKLLEPTHRFRIFISYKRSLSSAMALLFWSALRAEGYDVFIDIRNISPGDIWKDVIEKEIEKSNVFIPVVTTGTSASKIVLGEIAIALKPGNNRRIIPVLHDGYTRLC